MCNVVCPLSDNLVVKAIIVIALLSTPAWHASYAQPEGRPSQERRNVETEEARPRDEKRTEEKRMRMEKGLGDAEKAARTIDLRKSFNSGEIDFKALNEASNADLRRKSENSPLSKGVLEGRKEVIVKDSQNPERDN